MRVPMAVSVSLAESLSVFLAVAVVGRRGGVRAVLAGLGGVHGPIIARALVNVRTQPLPLAAPLQTRELGAPG